MGKGMIIRIEYNNRKGTCMFLAVDRIVAKTMQQPHFLTSVCIKHYFFNLLALLLQWLFSKMVKFLQLQLKGPVIESL